MSDSRAVDQDPVGVDQVARPVYSPVNWAAFRIRDSPQTYLVGLIAIWLLEIVVLLVLQKLGTGMGLRIRQMGEDRVWAEQLQFYSPSLVPKEFWLINDRNPLSPWWYLAAKPLIYASPYGIYLVRKLIDILCAVSVFLLVDQVGRGKQRLFAAACAMLTLFWNFSGYGDQIMWNFLGVLALSALTIWTFCKYVDSNRKAHLFLVASLLIYLFAIATYTLQASSFIGIFVLSIFRGHQPALNRRDWLMRARTAALETGFYLFIFGVYTMMWYTTARVNSDYYHLSLSLITGQFLRSVGFLVWHFDYPMFLQEVRSQWSTQQVILVGGLLFAIFGAVFWRIAAWEDATWRRDGLPRDRRRSLFSTIGFMFAVAVGLAAATVVLEATSDVWVPGLRARMIQQVFQPVVYLSIAFALLGLIRGRGDRAVRALPVVAAAALCTVATIVSLQYNRDLNHATIVEERFEAGLKAIVPQPTQRTRFIVRMAPGIWHNSDSLSDIYVQTFYNSRLVNMRVLQPGAPITKWEDYSTILFGPDDKGIQMSDSGGTAPLSIPYSQVRIVSFDGDNVELMPSVAPSDLVGLRVGFDRQEPIEQGPQAGGPNPQSASMPLCSYAADFTAPLAGTGWSVPERTPDGKLAFQWMASTAATLVVPVTCDASASIQVHAVGAMSADILDSVSLFFDDQPVALQSTSDATGVLMTGQLTPEQLRSDNGAHQLGLRVARTIVPAGGERTLAVAFDRIRVVPQPANGTR